MEIKVTFPGGKKTEAQVKEFVVSTDQSVANGGEGTAPEPFTLFLTSIVSCAGVYVSGFCQNRDIPTDGITLVQKAFMDPETHTLQKIKIQIQVPKSFPEKYLGALVKVANKCSVKNAILAQPEFETETVIV